MLQWQSLKTRVTIATMALFLIAIWSLVYFSNQALLDDHRRLLGEHQLSTVSVVAADVDNEVTFRLDALEKVASELAMNFDDPARVQTILEHQPVLTSLFNGGAYAIHADTGIAIADVPKTTGRIGMNVREKRWLIEALKGRSVIGKPVVGRMLGVPVFTMASPVQNERGKIVGVLAGVVDLSRPNFLNVITGNRYGRSGGYLLAAPQHGLFVTATDQSMVMKAFPVSGLSSLFERFLRGYEGSGITTDTGGVEVLSSAKRIPSAGWIVIARIPASEAFKSVNTMRQRMNTAAVGLTLLTGLLIFWIVNRQLAPVASAARLLAAAETGQPPKELPVVKHDEVGTLISAFNRLLTTLSQRETALLESQATLKLVLDTVPQSIFWKDLQGYYLGCNRTFADAVGVDAPEEIVGKTDFDLPWPRSEAEAYRADDREVIEQVRPKLHIIEPLQQADGRRLWIDTSKAPLTDATGRPFGILGCYEDITERKQVEEELNRTRAILRAAMDCSPAGIAIADSPDGELIYVNDAGLLIRGGERQAVVEGIGIDRYVAAWQLLDLEGRPLETEEVPLARAILFGETNSREFIIRRDEGDDRTVIANAAPIRNDAGEVIAGIVVFTDITERKKAEQERLNLEHQLQEVQKLESVGRLAGGVAHDFNNMLSVILGHAELCLLQLDGAGPLHAHLTEIRETAERSASLTRQLLAFARKQTITPRILDINEAVSSLLKMLRRLIGEDIQLLWHPGHQLWPVNADPSQIDQILANLCVNARDAIEGTGRISIATSNCSVDTAYCGTHPEAAPGDYVKLTVSDTGIGIDQKIQGQIFEPFFTTKESGKGTGLGLAMVYGAVKQNNGFINFYSEPGRGSTFSIHLPRHYGGHPLQESRIEPQAVAGGSETILLVEDDPSILKVTATMLASCGFTVLEAATPGEAERIARERTQGLDLLITDVVMPQMNGRDLAQSLLALHAHLKVIYMSGYTADIIANHGIVEEGISFIQKPFTLSSLAEKVRAVLDS